MHSDVSWASLKRVDGKEGRMKDTTLHCDLKGCYGCDSMLAGNAGGIPHGAHTIFENHAYGNGSLLHLFTVSTQYTHR
jgi:hypothetical protein